MKTREGKGTEEVLEKDDRGKEENEDIVKEKKYEVVEKHESERM